MKKILLLFFGLVFTTQLAFGAIAFDATSTANAKTWTHITSGSNRALIVSCMLGVEGYNDYTNYTISAVTYNGVSMTLSTSADLGDRMFYLLNPALGSNTVSVTTNQGGNPNCSAASYTGVSTVGTGVKTTNTYVTSLTQNVTTTVNNSWLVGAGSYNDAVAVTAGANTTLRSSLTGIYSGHSSFDSGGAKTPTGTYSIAGGYSNGNSYQSIQAVELTPAASIDVATVNKYWGFFKLFRFR